MNISWYNINRALDELIDHEEGIRFQRLAISLAKQRWPAIVATEVKKNGGEDALTHPYLTEDGKRFDIASSITATLEKISRDAQKIYDRGVTLDLLIFYTPRKVFNDIVQNEWTKEIKSKFGCDLLVISREDIILELLKPQNHWICSKFLRLDIPIGPSVDDATEKANRAACKIIQQWKRRSRFNTSRLIDIDAVKIDENRRPTGEIFNHHEICTHLADGGRAILYGAPGAGKTTALIQISERLLDEENRRVPLLISLPEWIESGGDILAFVTQHPDFIAAGLSQSDLALLHQSARLVFILNGWNEIPVSLLTTAGRQLYRLDREFPAAGVIVGTREHDIKPPLLGTLDLKLMSITDSQRQAFVRAILSDRAEELLSRIESDPVLSEITRTPLILSEVTNTYESGSQVARTKSGVLQSVVRRTEESEEHSTPLQTEPIWGRATKYLGEIAASMTQDGRTTLNEDRALEVVTTVNEQLKEEGQLATLPDPRLIVNTLCAHHLLEKTNYPTASVHYIHQQFQELFAATKLSHEIVPLLRAENVDALNNFQGKVINTPAWGEPLKLLAEEISEEIAEKDKMRSYQIDPSELGKHVVEWSIPVDPIFAADLARICGPTVWDAVKGSFRQILRKWYNLPDEAHKACALAAMFATGVDDFVDIIWPLLEHPDQQVRLQSYRVPETFFLSSLGPDWRSRVCSWEEERRQEFVDELSFKGGPKSLQVTEDFAINDPSVKVRAAALNALRWQGATNKFVQILSRCDDGTFQEVIRYDILPDEIPADLLPRTKETYRKLLSESENVNERLIILLRMCKVAKAEAVDLLKTELADYSPKDARDDKISLLRDVLGRIASEDADWASHWVAHKQAEGTLWGEYWSAFLHNVPKKLIDELLQRFLEPDYPEDKAQKIYSLIAKAASEKHVQAILQKLVEIQQHIDTTQNRLSEPQKNLYLRLRGLARKLPWQILIDAVLKNYRKPKNKSELRLILELLGSTNLQEDDARQSLSVNSLNRLKSTLRDYSQLVLAQDDYRGTLKAYLSSALAKFGEAKDLSLVQKLICADIERLRKGAEAFKKGVRHGPQINGYRMSWSHWHVGALCRLDPENADQIILDLLDEPDYEEEAARGLVRLLKRDIPKKTRLGWYPDYESVFEAREKGPKRLGDENKRKRYAAAIMAHINKLKQECKRADNPDVINRRLKTLGAILATLNEPNAVQLILEVMALPGKWNGWTRVEALEALIKSGAELGMKDVEQVLGPTIEQVTKEGIHVNQNSYLLKRCLCIFAFTEDPLRAVERIKQLAPKYLRTDEMRDVIVALGQSRSKDAAKFVIDLAQDPGIYKILASELLKALASLRFPETIKALLSTIDPKITQPKLQIPKDYFAREILSQAIADLSRDDGEIKGRIFHLCDEELPDSQREIIANVIKRLSTSDAVIAGLNLISDKSKNPVPYLLREAIKDFLIEKVPAIGYPGAYELEPREDREIRCRLFDMVLDDSARRHSALELLSFIIQLRLEYGKPATEPRHPNFERGKPWPPLELIGRERVTKSKEKTLKRLSFKCNI